MRLVTILFALSLLAAPAYSRTWHIEPDGTGDAPTIQAGIDSTTPGDTVLLGAGVFHEHSIHMANGICLIGESGRELTTIDAQQQGRVLSCSFVESSTLIKGLTVRNGYVSGGGDAGGGGGLLLESSSPTIENCTFERNSRGYGGGGCWSYNAASPILENCLFTGNVCSTGGGFGTGRSNPILLDCVFENNTSLGDGGGAWFSLSIVSLSTCEFIGNTCAGSGGAAKFAHDCNLEVKNCILQDNLADSQGGSFYLGDHNDGQITDCRFTGNAAPTGGALSLASSLEESSGIAIQNCYFADNSAEDGGGIYMKDYSSVVSRCVFTSCLASGDGGAMYLRDASPTISNCSMWENKAGRYGAGVCGIFDSAPVLSNSIIAFQESGDALHGGDGASFWLECTDLFGHTGGWPAIVADQYGIRGNFSGDPLFCDASAGDLTLRSDSPCLPGNHPDGADCGLIGAFGEGCGGPTAVERTSWGAVKAMFR